MLDQTKRDLLNPASKPEQMAKLDSYRQFLGMAGTPPRKLFEWPAQVLLDECVRFIEHDLELNDANISGLD